LKVSIVVTDDKGNIFRGETELDSDRAVKPEHARAVHGQALKSVSGASVNFSSPIRAFMKRHARGMGGPQKFALLIAYMTKGDTDKQVRFADVKREWNRMKALLDCKFNPAHAIRAKEHEWVDSPKNGLYILLSGWKGIFNA
jgi:hypothetical protein